MRTTVSLLRARLGALALPVVMLLAAAGCIPGAAGSPSVAATVNGEEIPLSEVERRFASVAANPQVVSQLEVDQDGSIRGQIQAQVLTQIVRSLLVQQGAEELGIDVTADEIAQTRARIVEEVGGQEAFDRIVEQNALTPDDIESSLRELAYQERIQERLSEDIEVTEAEVREFYDQERDRRFDRASARHIMVESEQQAQAVVERLEAGEQFADLAAELSIDEGSAQSGGDLGEFSRGRYPPDFEEAIFGAGEGELIGPLQIGGDTWHVVEVTGRTTLSFDEAADEIRSELLQSRRSEVMQRWQQQGAEQAEVVVNPRFGRWDPVNSQVVSADPLGDTQPAPAQPFDGDQ